MEIKIKLGVKKDPQKFNSRNFTIRNYSLSRKYFWNVVFIFIIKIDI